MLNQEIIAAISEKLDGGTVERIIAEEFEKCLKSAVQDLLRDYGDVGKVLREKIKSTLIPIIDGYNYQRYIVKLDAVLQEVINTCTHDNRKMLENFKELMIPPVAETVAITELWDIWKKHVAANVETDELEVKYDDGPHYEEVLVTYSIIESDRPDWSNFNCAILAFECDHDNSLNFEIPLSRWEGSGKPGWNIDYKTRPEISSLRRMDQFEVLLVNLTQNNVKLIFSNSETSGMDNIIPDKEPEATYS